MMDDMREVRQGIGELKTALAIHDQRVEINVGSIRGSQERMADAIEKISEATVAIRALAERWDKNKNGNVNFRLTPKTVAWLLAAMLGLSAGLGAGNEAAHRLFHAFIGESHDPQGGR